MQKSDLENEELSNFIINEAYPEEVHPISCILTGSRAYGISHDKSDFDYLGIHLMDTVDILEHPAFRPTLQVIRKKYDKNRAEIHSLECSSHISIDSFEIWKIISMILKGSHTVYEILYMPEIHHDNNFAGLLQLFREMLNSKIGLSAKGHLLHAWKKNPHNSKKIILAYFKLIQAIHFLKEEEFVWNVDDLFEYQSQNISTGKIILAEYKQNCDYLIPEDLISSLGTELGNLSWATERAMALTRFPSQSPKSVLLHTLKYVKQIRSNWI